MISRADLEMKRFANLAEALQDQEGIDVFSNTGKTGGLNISIRGMPSEYTLILIDGRRQNVAEISRQMALVRCLVGLCRRLMLLSELKLSVADVNALRLRCDGRCYQYYHS
ncbi:TonB-dependent receptor plug domain-containing protein [Vibrio metschnikovii]